MSVKIKVYNIKLLKRLFTFTKDYYQNSLVAFFSVIGLSVFAALRPLVIEKIVDNNLVAQTKFMFFEYALLLLVLLLMEVFSNYLFIYNAGVLGQSVVKDIRVKLFNHIQNFKLKYYDDSSVGILITRTVTDMERIADIFGQGLFLIISDLLKMLIVSSVMIYMNIELSLIVFLALPFILFATKVFQKYMKRLLRK